jgi:TIR domain-containing protein
MALTNAEKQKRWRDRRNSLADQLGTEWEWDVFVSHASEDQPDFVEPLAKALESKGLKVWYAPFALTVGDSLRRSIETGLAGSRFGIVVLSPPFFAKEWPQSELDGLVARETGDRTKVILPVWHNITLEEVRRRSPILADRVAVLSAEGLAHVVDALLLGMGYVGRRHALEYLRNKDSELGSAIRDMVWRSAWGKWYRAQLLANVGRSGSEAEENALQAASHLIDDQLINGELVVHGRLPGRMDYEPIPRTHWRSSAVHFVHDPVTLWKMIIIPRGGAEIDPSGVVTGSDQAAVERTAALTKYDSLIVDAFEFEKLWPRRDTVADDARHELLRTAQTRGRDEREIQVLSED